MTEQVNHWPLTANQLETMVRNHRHYRSLCRREWIIHCAVFAALLLLNVEAGPLVGVAFLLGWVARTVLKARPWVEPR